MRTKKLYITPSIEEVSIEENNIIATSLTPDGDVNLDVDFDDREDEGVAQ